MPRWEEVTSRISNIALSPTGRRVVAEARGEIFTIPAEKGDIRNLTNSSGSAEREPAWSPDGKWVSYFSDKSGENALVIESQDGLQPPREIKLPNPKHYYTPSWSPDSKKLLYHDTDLKVWVIDIATGQATQVGRDPWMVPQRTLHPTWSPDSKWVAYASRLNSLYRAVFVTNVESGETKQVTDGLADVMFPVWDSGGKYLWFLASTDFALRSQWLDMTSYDREETFGLYFAVLKKERSEPAVPESDEDQRRRSVHAGPAGGGGGGGGRGVEVRSERSRGRRRMDLRRAACAAAIAHRVVRSPCRSISTACRSASSRCPTSPSVRYSTLKAGAPGTVYYMEAGGGGAGRGGAGGGSVLHRYRLERSPVAGVRARRRGVRGERRRPQTALSHRRWWRRTRRPRRRGGWRRRSQPVPRRCRSQSTAGRRRDASTSACACIWNRARSSGRSSTKAGASSATTSTCRTCTAATGRR